MKKRFTYKPKFSKEARICKICGKEFATRQGLCGHSRVHSSSSSSPCMSEINEAARNFVLFSEQAYGFPLRKESSFMTEIEQLELNEAAISLEMLSERLGFVTNLPIAMDLEQEKIIHCADSKQDLSDVVAQALPSPLRSKSSYECNICGKIFGSYQALGGHKRGHRLSTTKKDFEDGNSLFWSPESGAKKVVEHSSLWTQPVNPHEENNCAEWLSNIDPSPAPFHFKSLTHLLAECENELTKSYEMRSLYKVKADLDSKVKDGIVTPDALKSQLAEKDSLIADLKKKLETQSAQLLSMNKEKESLQKKLAAEKKKLWSEQLRLRDSQAEEVYRTRVELTKKFADRMDKVKKYLKDRAEVELELSRATGTLDCLKVLIREGKITVPEDTMKILETDILWYHAKLEGMACEDLTPNVLEVISPVPPFVRPSVATELRFDHIN